MAAIHLPFDLTILDRLQQVKEQARQAGKELKDLDKQMAKQTKAGQVIDPAVLEKYKAIEKTKNQADSILKQQKVAAHERREFKETEHVVKSMQVLMTGEVAKKIVKGELITGMDLVKFSMSSDKFVGKVVKSLGSASLARTLMSGLPYVRAAVEVYDVVNELKNTVHENEVFAKDIGRKFAGGEISEATYNFITKKGSVLGLFGQKERAADLESSIQASAAVRGNRLDIERAVNAFGGLSTPEAVRKQIEDTASKTADEKTAKMADRAVRDAITVKTVAGQGGMGGGYYQQEQNKRQEAILDNIEKEANEKADIELHRQMKDYEASGKIMPEEAKKKIRDEAAGKIGQSIKEELGATAAKAYREAQENVASENKSLVKKNELVKRMEEEEQKRIEGQQDWLRRSFKEANWERYRSYAVPAHFAD